MTSGQHQLFDRFVQAAAATRADLHDLAWTALGVLLLVAILLLSAIGIWLLQGGFSRWCNSAGTAALKDWPHER